MIGFRMIISWGTQICNAYFCHGNLLELSLASFLMFDFFQVFCRISVRRRCGQHSSCIFDECHVFCLAMVFVVSHLSFPAAATNASKIFLLSSSVCKGYLRVPLDRPGKGLTGQIYRFHKIIRTAGHLHEAGGQGLDCLVVAVVHAKLLLFQQGSRGCIRQDAHRVGGTS